MATPDAPQGARRGLSGSATARGGRGERRGAGAGAWRLWIDTGGTFTDCLAVAPDGVGHRVKVLSSSALRTTLLAPPESTRLRLDLPAGLPRDFFRGCRIRRRDGDSASLEVETSDPSTGELGLARAPSAGWRRGDRVELRFEEEAAVLAARLVTATAPGAELPPMRVRLATTRGTNALLERKGEAVALFITRGFADLLRIGTQQRPDLFALRIVKAAPLPAAVVEVDERLAADGAVLREVDLEAVEGAAAALPARGITAAAVALLHGYRAPEQERRVGETLRRAGFEHVTLSSDVAPRIKLLPRAETAVVDAYLSRVVRGYLDGVRRALGGARVHVMTSAGGLVGSDQFRPKDSLLSGPAGGVVGAVRAGTRSGRRRLIAFDMGGTSTDVSRFDGELDYRFDTEVGGVRLMSPALAIETVAAGGGSVCRFRGERLQVGPESAGADPGPACYGAGGPLCLTDVNLLLGRLAAERFGIPVDRRAAERAARDLWESVPSRRRPADLEHLLAGLARIADERMAEAVRHISIRGGYRPADYTLVAFGGAGAQHACSLAALLGMREVLVPAEASLLSAAGLGAARLERFAERQLLAPLDDLESELPALFDELAREATAAVLDEGVAAAEIEVRVRRVNLRLRGQDATLAIDPRPGVPLEETFRASYRDHYGYDPPARPLEVDSLRVVASSRESRDGVDIGGEVEAAAAAPRRAWFDGGWLETRTRERVGLAEGESLAGPLLVLEANTATVVPPGWSCRRDAAGALILEREGGNG